MYLGHKPSSGRHCSIAKYTTMQEACAWDQVPLPLPIQLPTEKHQWKEQIAARVIWSMPLIGDPARVWALGFSLVLPQPIYGDLGSKSNGRQLSPPSPFTFHINSQKWHFSGLNTEYLQKYWILYIYSSVSALQSTKAMWLWLRTREIGEGLPSTWGISHRAACICMTVSLFPHFLSFLSIY